MISSRATDRTNSSDRCVMQHVRVHQQSFAAIQSEINTMREYGGNFKYNRESNTLSIDKNSIVRGQHDNVTIPHGMYEFHTHPAVCDNGKCALGIPSTQDIKIHLEDMNSDCYTHFVFEKDGMWLMIPSTALRGHQNKQMLAMAHKKAAAMVSMLTSLSMSNYTQEYIKLRNQWIQVARNIGVHMQFVPYVDPSESPTFSIPVPCQHMG